MSELVFINLTQPTNYLTFLNAYSHQDHNLQDVAADMALLPDNSRTRKFQERLERQKRNIQWAIELGCQKDEENTPEYIRKARVYLQRILSNL